MNADITVTVLAGDTRQLYAAKRLAEKGYSVSVFGFELNDKADTFPKAVSLEAALRNDIILLPLPVSKNNRTLNASFSENEIPLKSITDSLPHGKHVLLGMGSDSFVRELLGTGAEIYDYFKREELTIKNALLTAEGIVGIILDKLPVTVYGLKAAVTGYGRVGFFTCRILKAMGAEVTVFARSAVQRTKAETAGLNSADIKELNKKIKDFDCVINTVPSRVINAAAVESSAPDCLFIETASAPYGIDFNACADKKRALVKAFSLPGKTSPETAGNIIADTADCIIREAISWKS